MSAMIRRSLEPLPAEERWMNEKPAAYNESAIRGSSMQNRSINTVQGRAFTATVSGRKVLGAPRCV